jgi:hypothetical protein
MCRTNNGGRTRHLITIACFALAVVCYITGAQSSALALSLVGGALELVGWARIFKRRQP